MASPAPRPVYTPDAFNVRLLDADDAPAYRNLRHYIMIVGDGRYFGSSYTREDGFQTETDWRNWCKPCPEHSLFGIFHGKELIGVMGAVQSGRPEEKTVEWEATYLKEEYRFYGLAKTCYEAVKAWTIQQGYKRAIVYIREDNERSRQIRERQGFQYTHTIRNEKWADGSTANCDAFSLDLVGGVTDSKPKAGQNAPIITVEPHREVLPSVAGQSANVQLSRA